MDILFNIVVGVVILVFAVLASIWPLVEERDRKEREKRFNKSDVKYNDGDNT